MPLFQREEQDLSIVIPKKFANEKELQTLIEKNLPEMFSSRFVATEFSTGPVHEGRIDTLALSEDNNPIIIEYKVIESSQLVNQSLYYLSWMNDHRGDFEIAVQKAFPNENVEVDWSSIRVICLAPDYKKYDLHAVQMMGSNIELWQYRYYENGALFLEEVFKKSLGVRTASGIDGNKNPVMVEAGKKAAITRATGVYTMDQHFSKVTGDLREITGSIQKFVLGLDEAVEEAPKKHYVAYRLSQNFVCMEVQKRRILLFLKFKPSTLETMPPNCRDVTELGHFGTGNLEVSISTNDELDDAKPLIETAFANIGGN